LGAKVPAGDAERLYPEFPVQSLILLTRAEEDVAPALLTIFRGEQRWPAAWLAAGALLLERHADGFAAAVVESMTVHAQVMVTEPGAGSGGSGSSLCCGGGISPQPRAGWPPLGVYAFTSCGDGLQPGATVLAGGTDPAYYHRQVTANYQLGGASGCCNPDKDVVRQHYLTTLLSDSAEKPPVRAHVSHTIVWQGPEAYLGELAAFIGEQEHLVAELTRRLHERNLLSEAEVKTLRPRLQIRVWDYRASPQPELPAVATLAENITVEP
jgi:hypothetical protein